MLPGKAQDLYEGSECSQCHGPEHNALPYQIGQGGITILCPKCAHPLLTQDALARQLEDMLLIQLSMWKAYWLGTELHEIVPGAIKPALLRMLATLEETPTTRH